ncbi:hypothetical protein [Leisingera methylohalidivorans]|uniref:hypothetical protein n=1 Tax=Leisingera methylohalidivorans TaxID=133924 RepID=UPI0003FED902|nr:hypothetical protein [Leisingera methylohalidivorans]
MAKTVKVTSAALAAAGIALTGGATQAATWRYTFAEAITEVQGVYARTFKPEIKANADHEIQLFPYGTLGAPAGIMERTLDGIPRFVEESPGFTSSPIPEAQVFFVPYLLPTDQDNPVRFYKESKATKLHIQTAFYRSGAGAAEHVPQG